MVSDNFSYDFIFANTNTAGQGSQKAIDSSMSAFSIGSFIALNKIKGGKRTPKAMLGWKPMSFLCNWETLTRHNVENTSDKIVSVLTKLEC